MVSGTHSLKNMQELQVDIGEREESIDEATRTANTLKRLVGDDDQQYISEMLEGLKFGTQEVGQEAEERVEQLEERYKSWKVSASLTDVYASGCGRVYVHHCH